MTSSNFTSAEKEEKVMQEDDGVEAIAAEKEETVMPDNDDGLEAIAADKEETTMPDLDERYMKLREDASTALLPGIPDSITSEVIGPLLPWTAFHSLSSGSRRWNQAVQSREMYDARVRSHSTAALAVINYSNPDCSTGISLYSVKNKAWYQVPPIPNIAGGSIPRASKCLTLDGKIYILGGFMCVPTNTDSSSGEVYMLDVAGQRQWKRCADMLVPRHQFGCGVMDGKIYVIGGSTLKTLLDVGEVFDPELNVWTAMKPMTRVRFNHEVGTMGDELVVYGGECINPDWQPRPGRMISSLWMDAHTAYHLEIYNPVQDTWRTCTSQDLPRLEIFERLFISEGKLYSMTASAIFFFDIEKRLKTRIHSCSYAIEPLTDIPQRAPQAILPLPDGELLAVLEYDQRPFRIRDFISRGAMPRSTVGLLHSRCFGIKDRKLVWQEVECSVSFDQLLSPFIVTLRL